MKRARGESLGAFAQSVFGPPEKNRLEETWLGRAIVALAVVFIAVFVAGAVARLRYPYAVEWIEGGLQDETRRILEGRALYVAPSIDYVPFIYNPLYFWVCAGLGKVLGLSFFTMRLVSFSSSLGAMLLLRMLVVRETQSRGMGLVAAGLYAGTYKASQQFMDAARVDSMFVALLLLAAWILRTARAPWRRLAASGVLVCVFLAKQSGAFVVAATVVYVVWDEARRGRTLRAKLGGLPFAACALGGIGLSVAALSAESGGWYWYYAVVLPNTHSIVPNMWTEFWTTDMLGVTAYACLGAVFILAGPSGIETRARGVWAATLVGVLLSAWSGRLHDGGWANVLMPAYAVLSGLFAVAVHAAYELSTRARPESRANAQRFVGIVGVLQMVVLLYDPRPLIPTASDEQAGARLVSVLSRAEGDVFSPADSYLETLAGKRPYLHEMAANDVLRGPASAVRDDLIRDIRGAFRRRQWKLVVTDDDWFAQDVVDNYRRLGPSVSDPTSFFPVAGGRLRPGDLFKPN